MDILSILSSVVEDFADPRKRIFVGYLALSVVLALAWLFVLRRQSFAAALHKVFDRKVLFSGSAKADYKIFVINRLITLGLSPMLITHLGIATAVYLYLHGVDFLSRGAFADTPTALVVALFSVAMFVVDDFSKYLVHRWMHRWPLLWAIHQTHHSATTMTPITVYRTHPLEGILYGLRGAVAQGTTIATFLFLFGGDKVNLYTVLGANVIVFAFHITGSNLRHSHISIHYWPWLERLLISPAQHQLHHSVAKKHYDKNFGAALAVWDWMFGSLHLSEPEDKITFGLTDHAPGDEADLVDIYLRPFRDIFAWGRRRLRRLVGRLAIRRS